MNGAVKWFNDEKGYGFIKYKGMEDIFIQYSAILNQEKKNISQDDVVEFELIGKNRKAQLKRKTTNKIMEVKINGKMMELHLIKKAKEKWIDNDSNYKTLTIALVVLQIILPIITAHEKEEAKPTVIQCHNCNIDIHNSDEVNRIEGK